MYLCTMKSTEAIEKRINDIGTGIVFSYSDLQLPPESQMAAAMALSRMVAQKKIKKVGKGRFYRPAISRLGEMSPMLDELTKDLLYKDGKRIGYITGMSAFSQLGLTTQISSKILIGSRYYRRPMKRGNYEISFTKQENDLTEESIPLLRILDSIKFIREIPACTIDEAVLSLLKIMLKLNSKDIKKLILYSKCYPASVKALLGSILEKNGQDYGTLKLQLNPLTRYDLGILESTLPNKNNWNIR